MSPRSYLNPQSKNFRIWDEGEGFEPVNSVGGKNFPAPPAQKLPPKEHKVWPKEYAEDDPLKIVLDTFVTSVPYIPGTLACWKNGLRLPMYFMHAEQDPKHPNDKTKKILVERPTLVQFRQEHPRFPHYQHASKFFIYQNSDGVMPDSVSYHGWTLRAISYRNTNYGRRSSQ